MFLNVNASASAFNSEGNEFTIALEDNPLIEFVELPEAAVKGGLQYNTIYAGVIRGALEMLQIQVETSVTRCPLLRLGDPTEIRVKFINRITDELPPADF